jgi:hypothetical protein
MPLDAQYPYTGIEVLGVSFRSRFVELSNADDVGSVSLNLLNDYQSLRYPEFFCKQPGRGEKL